MPFKRVSGYFILPLSADSALEFGVTRTMQSNSPMRCEGF